MLYEKNIWRWNWPEKGGRRPMLKIDTGSNVWRFRKGNKRGRNSYDSLYNDPHNTTLKFPSRTPLKSGCSER